MYGVGSEAGSFGVGIALGSCRISVPCTPSPVTSCQLESLSVGPVEGPNSSTSCGKSSTLTQKSLSMSSGNGLW